MKFQLIVVEYTGLQFITGVFNPKPEALGDKNIAYLPK